MINGTYGEYSRYSYYIRLAQGYEREAFRCIQQSDVEKSVSDLYRSEYFSREADEAAWLMEHYYRLARECAKQGTWG